MYLFITIIVHCLPPCHNVNSMRNGVFEMIPIISQEPRTTWNTVITQEIFVE